MPSDHLADISIFYITIFFISKSGDNVYSEKGKMTYDGDNRYEWDTYSVIQYTTLQYHYDTEISSVP